jgi:uncharacterized protein
MKWINTPQTGLAMGRRSFLTKAALGAGVGLAAPAIVSRAVASEPSVIASRDQDLAFIATEETYTTDELIALNAINDEHVEYLKETGLAELGPGRIGAMDEAGINVQILSAHTPGVQNVAGQQGIDFAKRLNKMIATGPMANYPGGIRPMLPCPFRIRRRQRMNWSAPFGRMGSSER